MNPTREIRPDRPAKPSPRISIAAVGDVQVGDCSSCTGFGFASRYSHGDLAPVFEAVREDLVADITIGNLETVLSRSGADEARWSTLHMRGYPQYGSALRDAGFNVMNIANNHSFQHGKEAFVETCEILEEAGVLLCGKRGVDGWSSAPEWMSLAGGVRIGFLGYSLRPRQFRLGDPPYAEGHPPSMLAEVDRLASDADCVIVSLHWGEEYVGHPLVSSVRFAHELAEAGATLVLGHHPHVLGPVQAISGTLVAYSLGNFVTDMLWSEALRCGAILRVSLERGEAMNASIIPTRVDDGYRVMRSGRETTVPASREVIGLTHDEHARLVQQTVRRNRRQKYRYALKNALRYPPRLLAQLMVQTLKNKLGLVPPEMRLRPPPNPVSTDPEEG